ncbi:hypothetical protein KB206_05485 [Microvirga sp. STS02]|uniref:nucleotide-diphospho-sugar transferase n=1 Tax=Hymenobacter negativus TaxID=2795026 RepID=UPI0018DE156A|nr:MULTISPECIES: nucleotide-diphospho-sugar transferase [Bacteria]MBH8568324.1 nucleotide-diphospho-sugar transferase [Hymenobacter negativus]MBR7208059.1 hypothetical protein [Microvirga sp. STS02]
MPTLPTSPAPERDTPVLLIVFNRPEAARRVLEALRQAQPARLYVAADGPRPSRPADAALCRETRALIAAEVDWPCTVRTLFRDDNLGCGLGPATAIDWFFQQEPEGIILEDDCLPTASFFGFCAQLLRRYRYDSRVMHISGNNLSREARQPAAPEADSYHFSGRVHSWGWATWRRAWRHFDLHLTLLTELRRRGELDNIYPAWLERQYWLRKFEAVRLGPQPPHIWDYQWHFAVACNGGLTIIPAVNLVTNIGFGDDATHTFDPHDQDAHPAAHELAFPLRHPPTVLRDARRDARHFREHLAGRAWATARRLLARLLPAARPAPASPPRPVAAPVVHPHPVSALSS